MSLILQKASVDLLFPNIPIKDLKDLSSTNAQNKPTLYFDAIERAYVILKYPNLQTEHSGFFKQLEARITTSFQQDETKQQQPHQEQTTKSPWYNPTGLSTFWNGKDVLLQQQQPTTTWNVFDLECTVLDKSMPVLFIDNDTAVIPMDVRLGSAEESGGMHDVEIVLSLMWKPSIDSSSFTSVRKEGRFFSSSNERDLSYTTLRDAELCAELKNNIEIDNMESNSISAVTLPLRRTIRKTHAIQQVFLARLQGSDSSTEEEENLYLSIEMENKIHTNVLIESVDLSLPGCSSRLVTLDNTGEGEDLYDSSLGPDDTSSYLFKLTLYDRTTTTTSSEMIPSFSQRNPFQGQKLDITVKYRPLYPNGEKSRRITSRTTCILDEIVPNNDVYSNHHQQQQQQHGGLVLASFSSLQTHEIKVPQPKAPELGVALSFTLLDETVKLNKIFKVQMMISNLSHEPLSLELIVPHRQDSSSLSATGLEQEYNYSINNNKNNSVKVAMDPVAFLQKYEQECLDSGSNGNSSFVCLETSKQANGEYRMATNAKPQLSAAKGGQSIRDDKMNVTLQTSVHEVNQHTKLKYRNLQEEKEYEESLKEEQKRREELIKELKEAEEQLKKSKKRNEKETEELTEDVLREFKEMDKEDDDDVSESDEDEDESEEEEDDEEELLLMKELEKIKQEKLQREQEETEKEILNSNPLLSSHSSNSTNAVALKRRWDDDVVFRNQQSSSDGGQNKKKKEFINDLIRTDFHKKFMNKYIK
ncbi:hypothetical protein MP638_003218 [Amoeboaphelidium occidentale]|nr:hypothetical protein MP638_003218 [Amoeboaphelidium occidentale]